MNENVTQAPAKNCMQPTSPEMSIQVPRRSLERLLGLPGSVALRIYLLLCLCARDGVAYISARDLSLRAEVTNHIQRSKSGLKSGQPE